MSWWVQLIACFVAALAFSVLVHLPKNAYLITGLIAAAGYGVFLLLQQSTLGYFFATLLIGISCEICARIRKCTATMYITSAIIPLVPGVGLYRTMRYLVEGNASMAVSTGTTTVLGICGIALALTVSAVIFVNLSAAKKKEEP